MTQPPWTFVFAVMVTGFLVVAQIYAMLPLLSAIEADLNITDSQASFIPTAFGLAYAFGFLIFGPVADKIDRMILLVAGLVALAATSAIAALANTFHALVCARILQGFAAASFPATALALVSQKVPQKDQPIAISMLGFAFLSSAPLSQLIVGALELSFAALMWWGAGLYLLCAAVINVSGTPRVYGTPASVDTRGLADAEAGRHMPPLAASVIAPTTVLLCLVSFHSMTVLLAETESMIDPQRLRLAGFPPLLLCFLAPAITKRSGPALTACWGLAITALGMTVAALDLGFALASGILSAGVALAVPGLIAAVAFWSGEQVRARALATYTFFLFAGASVAPVIANGLFRIDAAVGFWVSGRRSAGGRGNSISDTPHLALPEDSHSQRHLLACHATKATNYPYPEEFFAHNGPEPHPAPRQHSDQLSYLSLRRSCPHRCVGKGRRHQGRVHRPAEQTCLVSRPFPNWYGPSPRHGQAIHL